MTLGEKIKKARKESGLTQKDLAEKLNVSRQAVTKWEGDKGKPDIENLQTLAALLDVSLDYLLDKESSIDKITIKESINLSQYTKKGKIRCRQDAVVCEKFKEYEIWPLLSYKKYTKGEKIIDTIIGVFTDAPFGIPDLIHQIDDLKIHYYLVNKDDKQFLVKVDEQFIESFQMDKLIVNAKFEYGNMTFKRCNYKVEV